MLLRQAPRQPIEIWKQNASVNSKSPQIAAELLLACGAYNIPHKIYRVGEQVADRMSFVGKRVNVDCCAIIRGILRIGLTPIGPGRRSARPIFSMYDSRS
jgi:hypothetical protein